MVVEEPGVVVVLLTAVSEGVLWRVALPATVVEPLGAVATVVLSLVVPGVTVVVLPAGVLTVVVELDGVLVVVVLCSQPLAAMQASAKAATMGNEFVMLSPDMGKGNERLYARPVPIRSKGVRNAPQSIGCARIAAEVK